jgi:hypothetical protein
MKHKVIDTIVFCILVLLILMLVGLVFDIWYIAYYPIPLLAAALVLMSVNKWKGVLPSFIIFFGILLFLFIWAGIGMTSQGNGFGGLSLSVGVFFYLIWPFISIFSGLFYAYVYEKTSKEDGRSQSI